jgi:hypothetical protein
MSVDMSKVKRTPEFARFMVLGEALKSSETSLTTLKKTVLLKQAESVIQLVARTIIHLRQNGGCGTFTADCCLLSLSSGARTCSALIMESIGTSVVHGHDTAKKGVVSSSQNATMKLFHCHSSSR